jgi:tRNA U34 5-carboxymethylaminomethyl modifying GTPase MnmE/TrmE
LVTFLARDKKTKGTRISANGDLAVDQRRCEQLKKKHPQFDVKPVTEEGAAVLEDEIQQPTEDQKRLERLEAMVVANSKQLQTIYKVLTWVLILVVLAVVLIWRPHF